MPEDPKVAPCLIIAKNQNNNWFLRLNCIAAPKKTGDEKEVQ
jgi:hypothetical protein